MASLKDFFISKVRVKLLKTFLEDPAKIYYVRQLVRKTDEEINAVRRELQRMLDCGMVKKEKEATGFIMDLTQTIFITLNFSKWLPKVLV